VDIRASDDDRERIVALLQRHTAAGRLDLDEFAERVQAACGARTLGELAVVTRDLPAEAESGRASTDSDPGTHGHRDLLLVFLAALVALVLLGIAISVSRS
jgi:hypothetical protein